MKEPPERAVNGTRGGFYVGFGGEDCAFFPAFCFKAFQPRMISPVAEAPLPSFPGGRRARQPVMYTFEPAISFTRFSVKNTLPLALVPVECYIQRIPMVAVIVHLCASMLQPRPSCQAVLCRRLAGSGVILCVPEPANFLTKRGRPRPQQSCSADFLICCIADCQSADRSPHP